MTIYVLIRFDTSEQGVYARISEVVSVHETLDAAIFAAEHLRTFGMNWETKGYSDRWYAVEGEWKHIMVGEKEIGPIHVGSKIHFEIKRMATEASHD